MKNLTLRELINRLEELSNNGRNDNMEVAVHVKDLMDYDCFDQPEAAPVTNAYIALYNDGPNFDESSESYEYIMINAHP